MEKGDTLIKILNYQIKYEKIYGEDTIVLTQVGSFFEVYIKIMNMRK